MFDGGADLAQRGVELDLTGGEVDAGESLVRNGVDSLDADVPGFRSCAAAKANGYRA